MPLIIDPESYCDVCLLSLSSDGSTPPHVIPCGHIFCRTCLHHIYPRNCPLCREPYSLKRVKKIITSERTAIHKRPRAESSTTYNPDEGDNMLQRLVISWDTQEELVALLAEVEIWLESRPNSTSQPLQKARKVLASYQELITQAENDQRTIRHLENSLQFHERLASSDRFTATAVEQSLLAERDVLHMKLFQYEAEVKILRKEITTLKHSRRPSSPSPGPLLPKDLPRPTGPRSKVCPKKASGKPFNDSCLTNGNSYSAPSSPITGPAPNFTPRTCSKEQTEIRQESKGKTLGNIHHLPTTAPRNHIVDNSGDLDSCTGRNPIVLSAVHDTASERTNPQPVNYDNDDDLLWILPWLA